MFDRLERSEIVLIAAVSFFAVTGMVGVAFGLGERPVSVDPAIVHPGDLSGQIAAQALAPAQAAEWFQSVRQRCNPVEVETYMSWQPAPPTPEGDMHKAACYALAGRMDRARGVILGLPADQRYKAAGVVFEAGHPAADAGDDVAAGPLMELVVEFWPNHYMALYHAGTSRFETGDLAGAKAYLVRFLEAYEAQDGWTRNAQSMLASIN